MFLHRELRIRLAQRVLELESLPCAGSRRQGKGMDQVTGEDHRIMPKSESLLCSNFFWLVYTLQLPLQLINPS